MVKLDAAVKFPPLWSRKASAPEPVETYREQPQRFPPVWGFKDYDWVEWTIDTNTVMERNFTETLGAGATVVLDPRRTASVFENSIPMRNMHELEWLAYYIDPPRWPAAIFGEIKPDLAAAGEAIFRSRCAACHEYGDDRRTPTGLIRLRGMRPEDVGTDPTVALRISCPVPDTGALVIPPRSYTAEDSQLLKDCAGVTAGTPFAGNSFARTVQVAVDSIKQKAYAAAGSMRRSSGQSKISTDANASPGATRCSILRRPTVPMRRGRCTGSGPRRPTCTTDRSRRCTTCCFPERRPSVLRSASASTTR
jgi:hypothetical protein